MTMVYRISESADIGGSYFEELEFIFNKPSLVWFHSEQDQYRLQTMKHRLYHKYCASENKMSGGH